MSLRQGWLLTSGVWAPWAYVLAVFVSDETVLGVEVRPWHWWPLAAIAFAVAYGAVHWCYRVRLVSGSRLKKASVASVIALASILAVDYGYAFFDNVRSAEVAGDLGCVNDDELLPARYYPTEENFSLYRPMQSVSGKTCGHWARASWMASPTLASTVFEVRDQRYSIDSHGFRETTPLEQAHVFALGNSFALGQATHQDRTWPEVLELLIERPVYNLSSAGSGPKQQLMLLEHTLQTMGDSLKIERLLWMVFEGNDLEDSYEARRPVRDPRRLDYARESQGTLLGALRGFPSYIKEGSAVNRLTTGEIRLSFPRGDGPYVVDGLRLNVPIYRSARYGARLFWPPGIVRAEKPRSYLAHHPNRLLLDQTFEGMRALSAQHGFEVTVMVAPTATRLYAQYYEGIPVPSETPHFIDYVESTSKSMGFAVLPLFRLMQPYAARELLYWRDDPHWNERGNTVVAGMIAQQVFNVHPSR